MATTGPQIVYSDGEPVAVILPIEDYREILERLEDAEDLAVLEEMRKHPLQFSMLGDVLAQTA